MQSSPPSVPLARLAIDRDAEARTRDGLIERSWSDPRTRAIAVSAGRVLLAEVVEGSEPGLEAIRPAGRPPGELVVYLGRDADGAAILGVVLDTDAAASIEPEQQRWAALREAVLQLDDCDAALAAELVALANWHAAHTHCPRCGAATEVRAAGWVRWCPVDRAEVFPRTDPAVIVLVTDADDRVLLGSNASWAPGRYSLLAGFVEPGESLEQAVHREIAEEAGIRVADVAYVASQPWPFPASIMLGFRARLADDQHPDGLRPDGEEILDLRWFSRAQLAEASGEVTLPGAASIARALLEQWYGGPLPDEADR